MIWKNEFVLNLFFTILGIKKCLSLILFHLTCWPVEGLTKQLKLFKFHSLNKIWH